MKKLVIISVISWLLIGCISWEPTDFASSDKDQYLSSKNGESLVIPPPLTNSNISDFYVLPNNEQNAKISIDPPAAN